MDVATGTADFAIEAIRMNTGIQALKGVDISAGMLEIGRKKVAQKGMDNIISLHLGDSENLPFDNNYFDAFTVGFGVRNFENLEKGLSEMLRVLKPNGLGIILEFSKPQHFPMKQLFRFYFRFIMPTIGKLISKDKRAYTYLPESVQAFPQGPEFLKIMSACGYREVKQISLSGGIASIYLGRK